MSRPPSRPPSHAANQTPGHARTIERRPRPVGRSRLAGASLVQLLLVALAGVLLWFDAPMLVQALFAGPVLVLITGDATRRLLLGRERLAADRLLTTSLSVVLAALMMLGLVLLASATGRPLTQPLLVFGVTVAAVVLVIAALISGLAGAAPPAREPAAETSPEPVGPDPKAGARAVLVTGVGVLVSAALLVGALAGARALRPMPEESYALLTFTDATRFGEAPVEATAGSGVTLALGLSSYHATLPSGSPEVSVQVGTGAATALRAQWFAVLSSDPFADGSTNERRGTITFTAPSQAGLYRVRISTPDPVSGEPLLLTTDLRVGT